MTRNFRKWLDPFFSAWVGVATHKIRSFLTILGVVIGVSAVIALMSIGRGTQQMILSSIESLGSNLLFITPGSTTQSGVRTGGGSAQTLTAEDAAAIIQQVDNVKAAAPVNRAGLQVVVSGQNMRTQVTGVTADYPDVVNLQLQEGDFISEYQYQAGMRVAVLGASAKTTLFGDGEAVGQQMRLGNLVVNVIGVLQSKGQSMMGSTDDAIYMPLTTLRQTVNSRRTPQGYFVVDQVLIAVADQKYTAQVMDDITTVLRQRHRLTVDQDPDFTITSQEDMIKTITQATQGLTLLLGAIAAISLLVGGIGVMNIMLVSVIERTREIGVRKALGAQEKDIWGQFLIEAAMLTVSGGVVGILIGWGVSVLVANTGTVQTVVSPDMVILAVGVSVAIGLFFGFYPAWQASRLNPIDALRSE
jgi:putative ABC transport system permease protein